MQIFSNTHQAQVIILIKCLQDCVFASQYVAMYTQNRLCKMGFEMKVIKLILF